jgi:hypothetical protein
MKFQSLLISSLLLRFRIKSNSKHVRNVSYTFIKFINIQIYSLKIIIIIIIFFKKKKSKPVHQRLGRRMPWVADPWQAVGH